MFVSLQIYLSTRSGSWLFNRVYRSGDPVDMCITTRCIFGLRTMLPKKLSIAVAMKDLNSRLDHAKYALQPKYPPFSAHPTINDELPNRIVSGSVIIKANVSRFTETGVEFEDGTRADDIDYVIMATGYIFGFPFLDPSIVEVRDNKVELYKYMFPPDLDHHTLAVIGCFQPLGAIMPISEMQCRAFTKVLKVY